MNQIDRQARQVVELALKKLRQPHCTCGSDKHRDDCPLGKAKNSSYKFSRGESIQEPSEIVDPEEAYLRISSEIYNGGMEQLIGNEGDSYEAVANLIDIADQIAMASPSWPRAKEILNDQLEILQNGEHDREDWSELGQWTDEALEAADQNYLELTGLLAKVDTDLGLTNDVLSAGDMLGIDKERQAQARRETTGE